MCFTMFYTLKLLLYYYLIRLVTGKAMVLDDGLLTINWVAATKGWKIFSFNLKIYLILILI